MGGASCCPRRDLLQGTGGCLPPCSPGISSPQEKFPFAFSPGASRGPPAPTEMCEATAAFFVLNWGYWGLPQCCWWWKRSCWCGGLRPGRRGAGRAELTFLVSKATWEGVSDPFAQARPGKATTPGPPEAEQSSYTLLSCLWTWRRKIPRLGHSSAGRQDNKFLLAEPQQGLAQPVGTACCGSASQRELVGATERAFWGQRSCKEEFPEL